jgi:pSer/pThr/pTyr-binding forkhead associated (FHA) protein
MSPDDKKAKTPSSQPSAQSAAFDDFDAAVDALSPFEGEAESKETKVVSIADVLKAANTQAAAPASAIAAFAGATIEQLPAQVMAVLEFKNGPAPVRLNKTVTVIGRAEGVADVVVADDGCVSRQHAAVVWADGAFYLEDLQSSNGTFLRGERIHRAPLAYLDEFEVGTYKARLRQLQPKK